METLSHMWAAIHSPVGASICLGMFVISEALAQIPAVESNSIFQLIRKAIMLGYEKIGKPQNPKIPE